MRAEYFHGIKSCIQLYAMRNIGNLKFYSSKKSKSRPCVSGTVSVE